MNKHGMCCTLGLLALGTVTLGFAQPASGKGHLVRTEKVFRAAPPAGGGVAGDGCTYANDDGASTNAFGVVGGGGVGSAAGYVAVDGCVTIDTIQVAWGPVTDGQACTLQIYADPNNDGDPSDLTPADRLASVAGVVANPDTDIFNDYAIPPVVVSGIFWVVAITEDSGDDFPLQVDGDDPVSPLNYILLGIDDVNDPFALTTTVLQEESNVMVRATGPGMEVACFGGDTNGDCQVNVTDLVNVISAWGTAGILLGSYDADLNDDGTVDVTDLVGGVITNWGSCDCAFRACCFQDGSCADITPDGCFRLGGEIQAAGSDCSGVECVNQLGACCLDGGGCVENLPGECDALFGTHQGVGTTCASGACDPEDNDLCVNAMALTIGQTVNGTTSNATVDEEAITCTDEDGAPQNVTAPGNWYTIVGTGNTIVASMCSMPTTYDAKMHVYCGTSCDSLFCLSANDDGCAPAGTSEVTWCSEAGQQYYIFISGFSDGTGPYELSVTSGGGCGETTPCQSNEDICDFALDIAPGQTINVSNASATTDGAVPDCGSGGQNGPGIWLQTIGDGTTFSLQLCNPVPASLNTRLNVYCGAVAGSCSSLDCAVTEPVNNSGCAPFTEKVTWCTELGREYYILVSGAGPASLGSVNVSLSSDLFGCKNFPCAPPLLNDECDGAISITDGSYPLDIGSASDSGPVENSCDFPFGDNDVHQDLWYDYTATCTGTLFVDTCGGFNDDTRLAIYQGCQCPPSSPPLECNDDHGNANEGDTGLPCPGGLEASLSIPVTQGQCYKIRVGAFSTSPGGDDLLNVGCEPAP